MVEHVEKTCHKVRLFLKFHSLFSRSAFCVHRFGVSKFAKGFSIRMNTTYPTMMDAMVVKKCMKAKTRETRAVSRVAYVKLNT